jgi:gamma-glutamyltranspeptidase/glutathione hydrolase
MFTTRPELMGTFGMVASTHWLASAAGMAMLEKGGNAFDAAVAAGLTLQVCEPHLNGPGGDLPIVMHAAKTGETKVICGQGFAPAGATISHYRDLGLDLVPGSGLLATVVPGAFDAWMLMLRDHGVLTFEDVLEPAIGYAANGVPLVERVCRTIDVVKELFLNEWPTSAALFLPGGGVPRPGTLFANTQLAATWKRLLAEAKAAGRDRQSQIDAARAAWYRGFVAETMDAFCRENEVMDVSGERHRGVLSADDMASWEARYEDPLTYDYHGYTVCKTGPWGQGPVLLQQLALLKELDIAKMDPIGPDFVHVIAEAAKLAFADREKFYGDPDFVDVPLDTLLSDEYNAARRALIDVERASLELRCGDVPGFGVEIDYARHTTPRPSVKLDRFGVGEPTIGRAGEAAGDTCHLDVIDRHGNMVSATPSGGWLQSSPTIPELGFCLNSRAQMFWLDEGHPAALAPGKRPRTTLTPSMALKDGKPYIAFGTPGGDQQDQWQLAFFLRHVHHDMNLQEAIDCPSWHIEHFPSSFYPRRATPGHLVLEGRMPEATAKALEKRGHRVEISGEWSEGRLSAATREDGMLKAGANPRGMQGYAVGR